MLVEFCHPFSLYCMLMVLDLPLVGAVLYRFPFLFCSIVSHMKPPVIFGYQRRTWIKQWNQWHPLQTKMDWTWWQTSGECLPPHISHLQLMKCDGPGWRTDKWMSVNAIYFPLPSCSTRETHRAVKQEGCSSSFSFCCTLSGFHPPFQCWSSLTLPLDFSAHWCVHTENLPFIWVLKWI